MRLTSVALFVMSLSAAGCAMEAEEPRTLSPPTGKADETVRDEITLEPQGTQLWQLNCNEWFSCDLELALQFEVPDQAALTELAIEAQDFEDQEFWTVHVAEIIVTHESTPSPLVSRTVQFQAHFCDVEPPGRAALTSGEREVCISNTGARVLRFSAPSPDEYFTVEVANLTPLSVETGIRADIR